MSTNTERGGQHVGVAIVGTGTAGHCQSWYLDDTGRNTTLWPGWTFDFRRRMRRFDPDKYVLERGTDRVAAG